MEANCLGQQYKLGLVQISEILGQNIVLPLAIGMLWAEAARHKDLMAKWKLDKIIYLNDFTETDVESLASCDMVCFSTYAWNVEYHIDTARQIKQINPHCYTVAGGPNFSARHRDFWQNHKEIFDLVILGEGELSFVDLLRAWPDQNAILSVPGAWTDQIADPTEADRISDTESLQSPFLIGFYDHMVRQIQDRGYYAQAVIQTNRGCPYHCAFCEEGSDYHNKLFVMHMDRIMAEIEWCGQNRIEFLTLADDNFGILSRDIDIMQKLCETKQKYGYPKILDATYAKNNPKNIQCMIEMDLKNHTQLIRSITMALQSENQQTLTAINRFNLKKTKQQDFLKFLKTNNVPCYAELIWPLPFENYTTLCTGIDNILEQGIDTWIGMYPLELQPSANLYHDFKDHYQFAPPVSSTSKKNRGYLMINRPMSSDWANHDDVVKGHVFYCWLTSLYFFGFARHALNHLKQKFGWSISRSINMLMQYMDRTSGPGAAQHERLKTFFHKWLTHQDSDNLNQFPGQQVEFWYPFTHHASWLQANTDDWHHTLRHWLQECDIEDVDKMIDQCKHGTVRYGSTYPYTTDNTVIAINHQQPKFADLHEFCRFYYWWKRKEGKSVTRPAVLPRSFG